MKESPCEEADMRIVVHLEHALKCGYCNVRVRTSDTDVLVILIGHFYDLLNKFPGIEVEVDFGAGKNTTLYCVRTICMKLGHRKSRAPVFHSFTGTDTTYAFRGKGKKSAWSTWDSFEKVTDAFLFIMENHFRPVTADSANFKSLERYTILLYDHTAVTESINQARRWFFTKKERSLETIPPTQVS